MEIINNIPWWLGHLVEWEFSERQGLKRSWKKTEVKTWSARGRCGGKCVIVQWSKLQRKEETLTVLTANPQSGVSGKFRPETDAGTYRVKEHRAFITHNCTFVGEEDIFRFNERWENVWFDESLCAPKEEARSLVSHDGNVLWHSCTSDYISVSTKLFRVERSISLLVAVGFPG